jgi:hypothetical protein
LLDANVVPAIVALGARRAIRSELDLLAESVTLRPEFFRQGFVDDGHGGGVRLGCFRQSEGPPAQDGDSHGGEIIGSDAVVSRAEGEALGGSAGLIVLAHAHSGALNAATERDHSERRGG